MTHVVDDLRRRADAAPARVARFGARLLSSARLARLGARLASRVPPSIAVRRPRVSVAAPRGDILLVTHDLSLSGAPRIVLELASMLIAAGYAATIVSPDDGPLAAACLEAGATLVVDARALDADSSTLAALAPHATVAFCNTIVTSGAVHALHRRVPTFWYLHEVSLVTTLLASDPRLRDRFAEPRALWCGSEQSARLVRPFRDDVRVVPYGVAPATRPARPTASDDGAIRIAVFGSLESRKGQDLAVDALRLLDPSVASACRLDLYGRHLDPAFAVAVATSAAGLPVTLHGELASDRYREALHRSDIVLVSSRDDTLPLVSLDALSAGRVLVCTATTGTADYLDDGVDGFVASSASAPALAATLARAIARRADWARIGENGEALFARRFDTATFRDTVLDAVSHAGRPAVAA